MTDIEEWVVYVYKGTTTLHDSYACDSFVEAAGVMSLECSKPFNRHDLIVDRVELCYLEEPVFTVMRDADCVWRPYNGRRPLDW